MGVATLLVIARLAVRERYGVGYHETLTSGRIGSPDLPEPTRYERYRVLGNRDGSVLL